MADVKEGEVKARRPALYCDADRREGSGALLVAGRHGLCDAARIAPQLEKLVGVRRDG